MSLPIWPPLLKQAAQAEMTVEPVRRMKVFDSGGWYWVLPRTQHTLEPLTPDSQGNMLHVVFKAKKTPEKLSLVVEPLKPESEHFGQNASMRFGMLFTPTNDAASFEATARIDEIRLSE